MVQRSKCSNRSNCSNGSNRPESIGELLVFNRWHVWNYWNGWNRWNYSRSAASKYKHSTHNEPGRQAVA
jgi:hypothetical protein